MASSSSKRVHFDSKPAVRVMRVWSYASHAARCGKWEQMARDRERFQMRIHGLSKIINPVLIHKYNKYSSSLADDKPYILA